MAKQVKIGQTLRPKNGGNTYIKVGSGVHSETKIEIDVKVNGEVVKSFKNDDVFCYLNKYKDGLDFKLSKGYIDQEKYDKDVAKTFILHDLNVPVGG